jgi:multiple sugar transport system permease protein
MRRRTSILHKVGIALILLWTLIPIYWAINSSFQTEAEEGSRPAHYLPLPVFTLNNYGQLLRGGDAFSHEILQTMLNSVIESGFATIGIVLVATLSGYAFARLSFRGRPLLFYTVLATMAIPVYALIIPVYRLFADIGLVNTYAGIVLVYISGLMPLGTWVMHHYFNSLPANIEEAGCVDGANRLQVLWHLMLPLSRPGIISTAIMSFLFSWAAFFFPLVLSTGLSTEPLSVAIPALQTRYTVPYTLLEAAGVLAIAIPAVVVLALNRYIVSGLLAGNAK